MAIRSGVLLAALLPAVPALGQGPPEVSEFRGLSLEQLLDVPIGAASHGLERPSQAPASAFVVTEDTIRARGYATLLDLLEDLPEFEIQRKASETRRNVVSVRGLFGNERLIILYDGVRVTPPSGDIYALGAQFSLRGAKRVEVVVGPLSALYGPDAFSGVVNVVTKSGRELSGAGLWGAYGQFDTAEASLAAGRALLSGAELAVTAHRASSGEPFLPGRYPGDFAWFHDQYQRGLMRTSPFAPPSAVTAVPVRPYDASTEALFLHTRLTLRDFELGYLRLSEEHPSATGVRPDFSLYVSEAKFKTSYGALYARHDFASDDGLWELASAVSHHSYEIDPQSRFLNTFSLYRDAYKYAADRTLGLSEHLSRRLGEASSLLLGLSFDDHSSLVYTADLPRPFDRSQSPDSQGFLYPGSEITDSSGTFLGVPVDFHSLQYRNLGAFAQLQLKELDWLQAAVGARYDHNSRYGDSLNPRAGVVVKPAEKLALKLSYGEAFLAPSPFRTHLHFGAFAPATDGLGQVTGLRSFFFHLPNPGLRPEKLRQAGAEASYRFTEGLWGSLSAYRSEVTDLIQDDIAIGAGTFKGWPVAAIESSVNRGTAQTWGLSARVDALVAAGRWRLRPDAAYSYSDGRVAGGVLPYSARHSVKAGLELGRGGLTLSPRLVYRSRSYNVARDPAGGLQSSAPYALVNLFARWADIVTEPLALSAFLRVTNLTDLRYRNAAFTAGSSGFPAVPQDPFTAVGGVSLEF